LLQQGGEVLKSRESIRARLDHQGMSKIELEQATPPQKRCAVCGGTGENASEPQGLEQAGACEECSGTGYVPETQ
jgi:DnaJ-class molecular chaperone